MTVQTGKQPQNRRRIPYLPGGRADPKIGAEEGPSALRVSCPKICFVAMDALGLEREGDQHKANLHFDEVYIVASR